MAVSEGEVNEQGREHIGLAAMLKSLAFPLVAHRGRPRVPPRVGWDVNFRKYWVVATGQNSDNAKIAGFRTVGPSGSP